MKKITHKSSFQVGQGQVHLTVTLGEGQFGSSTVVVGDALIGHQHRFDQSIGVGSQISGKTLRVVSVVTDVNPQTNNTDVTYQLRSDAAHADHTSSFTVEHDNDSVMYVAEIELKP
jgi:hypothetical protein